MKAFSTVEHLLRQPEVELHSCQIVPLHSIPHRLDYILQALSDRGMSQLVEPTRYDLTTAAKVHSPDYLAFLASAWQRWQDQGYSGQLIPNIWPARRMRSDPAPKHIAAQLGYYALAADSAITEGTWQAALSAKDLAMSGMDCLLQGEHSAFALCRPPGHHAARDQFGGYCFLNNVAIAAQHALDNGAHKVAILDVDFHHGNGTQDIFYQRDDVLTLSLHGDPEHAFPYFLGRAEETGEGAGLGCNVNYPLPPGTRYPQWLATLQTAFERIQQFGAQYLVVSLGVDTFENDPISFFQLSSADFSDYGHHIGKLGLPTLFVMEGGYAVKDIGINTVNVLAGFEAAVGGN